MNKQEKSQAVASLKDKFGRAKGLVLTHYKGLTVAEITDLRNILRAAGVEYKVVKNTLAKIASEGTDMAPIKDHMKGPMGVAVSYGDVAAMAKSILEYSKKNPKLVVMGGVVEGTFYDAVAMKKVAELPSREVMLGMMAGTLQAPTSQMARLLYASVARLGYALGALKDKKAA